MRRKITMILALLLMLAGLGVLTYPALSDYISRRNGSYAIQLLDDRMEGIQEKVLERQRELAAEYNARLGTGEPDGLDADYEKIMDFGGGIMGYIRIPKIRVNLPIYHGVEEDVLSKGVGHLPRTAFPIGGAGNHTVLSGHTGLPSAELFTGLTELEIGDCFYITALEDTLAYQVDQIRVVLPDEVGALSPVAGADYCTLVTCTPYGINSHRLLVRGSRVPMEQEVPELRQQEQNSQNPRIPGVLIIAAAAAAGILIRMLFLILGRKR